MEVLKEGAVPAPELWCEEVRCEPKDKHDSPGCGALLKVERGDLVLLYWKATHSNHYYTAVQCPRCKKYNRVQPPMTVWQPLHTAENQNKAIWDGFSDR